MVNLVTSVMQAGPNAASMVTSTSLPVRLVKLVRDYGAVVFVAAVVLAVAPALVLWVMVGVHDRQRRLPAGQHRLLGPRLAALSSPAPPLEARQLGRLQIAVVRDPIRWLSDPRRCRGAAW